MSDFERSKDTPDLNLSPDALKNVRDRLAKALILHGSISDIDPSKRLPDEQMPHKFEYVFKGEGKALITSLIFPEGNVMVSSAKAVEAMPLDDVPDDPDPNLGKYDHTVSLEVNGILYNEAMNTRDRTEVDVTISIYERHYSDDIAGTYKTEYSQDGVVVSPNNLLPSMPPFDADGVERLFKDRETFSRKLQLDDAELLYAVADYISAHPDIDE